MILKLKDVHNNPFRDLKGNPLIEAKIEELMASIHLTGYWNNCVVTKRNGKYFLAYGHHRIEAAKRCGLVEADFIVMELDDAKLIQILDNENRETYASSPASVIESVKAVVVALAEGSIPAFEVDPKANAQHIRHAPSYVAGKEPAANTRACPYTSTLVAKFLGRIYPNGRADTAVEAALNFLHLKELGAINNSVLVKDNQPITARRLFDITAEIKKRTETVQERRGKTQEELAKLREQQLELQRKQKEQEKADNERREDLLKKYADAELAESERKADLLAAQIKENDKRAKDKEVLNKLRMAQLDDKIAKKKEWEAAQQVQDAYLPIRRDVEAFISKYEMRISERNPEREEIKALAGRKGLRPEDRARAQRALRDYANWLYDWALPQLMPELKAAQKIAVNKRQTKGAK